MSAMSYGFSKGKSYSNTHVDTPGHLSKQHACGQVRTSMLGSILGEPKAHASDKHVGRLARRPRMRGCTRRSYSYMPVDTSEDTTKARAI